MDSLRAQLEKALDATYRIDREIGSGGMATVFLAQDPRHHRQVALKVLRPELTASLGAERFLREIEVTAGLQHPHILALYDSGQADGLLYYVMPYVPGDTLRARLAREGQLPVGDAVRIARGVAAALAYAHRRGVIHRDIKPENILLADGDALVADFGIARAIAAAGGDTLTGTGITLGTPTYMSPEQASAERQLDGRSDIYALGCVLYEMLAGDPPYGGATAQVVTARKMHEPVPSLRAIRDSVPSALEEIVARALARAPADRFATADEMGAALDRAISGPFVAATAADSDPRHGARARGRERLWAAVAGAATVVAVALGWYATGAAGREPTPPPVRSIIELPRSAPLAFVGEAPLRVGRRSLALSPDGSTLVYVGLQDGRTHLFVRSLEGAEVRRLEGTVGAYGPFFAPNGRWVAYFARHKLFKVAIDGGPPIELAPAPEPYGGVWLEDGRLIFAAREGSAAITVHEDGGPTAPAGLPVYVAAWSDAIGDVAAIASSTGMTTLIASLRDRRSWALTSQGLEPTTPEAMGRGLVAPNANASPQFLRPDILLVAEHGRLHALRFDPRTMRSRGTAVALDESLRQEIFGQFAQFTVGGDGTLVFAPGEDVARSLLVVADRRGGLDTLPFERAAYRNPRYSPDGRRLAVIVEEARGAELRVLDLEAGTRIAAVPIGPYSTDPIWSPDGRSISYLDDFTMTMRASGGTPETMPERRWLLSRSRNGHRSLWNDTASSVLIDSSGSVTRLGRFVDPFPELSPDGRWLAETRIGTRGYEVFVSLAAPDTASTSVTPEGCVEAYWSPDGRELTCFGRDNFLYAIPLLFDGDEVRGGTPRRVSSVPLLDSVQRSWTLSPDGQRMLFVAAPPSDTTTRLTVITNYRTLVERKLSEADR